MSNSKIDNNEKKTWKSLKEYYNDPDVLKAKVNEFSDGVTDDFNPDEMNGMSRRRFLALLTASAAVTATACSDYRDKGEIVPYNKRPEEILPGKPSYYASTFIKSGISYGVLVKTREGRPIKIDGNPDHPTNLGKIEDTAHASILNLYDPERLQDPKMGGRKTDWNTINKSVIEKLNAAKNANKEIAFVSNKIVSPSLKRLLNDFTKSYPSSKVYSYELFDNLYRKNAWEKTYGVNNLPAIKWDKANVILALDSDFLGREGNTVENTRLYTSRREVMTDNVDFNRLYVVEGNMSLTGMNADYRLRLRPDAQNDFVMSLLNEIVVKKGITGNYSLDSAAINKLSKYNLSSLASKYSLDEKKLGYLVSDLLKNQGSSMVYAGDTLTEDTHIAVNLLNEVLGNTKLYDFENGDNEIHKLSSNKDIENLIADMSAGKVDVLINFGADPSFHLNGFSETLESVPTSISLVESANDTSAECDFVLASNHYLESWGDSFDRAGVYSLQQPVIAPLFNTRQKEAVLLSWLSDSYSEDSYHKFLMDNFRDSIYKTINPSVDFNSFWYNVLHDGFVKLPTEIKKGRVSTASFHNSKSTVTDSYLVHLQPSYFVGNGDYANNGWLQELAHPISKVSWDNYAAVSPNTAKELGVVNEDVISVQVNGNSVNLPIMIQPGNADKVIGIELGYGRTVIGDAGKDAGFNANPLISSGESHWISSAEVSKTDETYQIVSQQEHHALDDTFVKNFHRIRNIIKDGTVEEYKKHPEFIHEHKHDLFSISKEVTYEGHKWAMSIDLNKCLGCTSCITSCNVENNVPVVGKDQVAVGREMTWMRIDRYYSGTPDEPIVSNQPMLCQHCDNAPCENVCPVNATNHSPDGLNQMAYNRCVGTRYCANNCPYKVRRFNFFNFRDHFADEYYQNNLTDLVHNPEVTVRSRGVMEKCTFCVQRIMDARADAIAENREIMDGDIVTACQDACPSQAIAFGDSNNEESEVSKYRKHDLAYHVLEELNVRPNVTYIAKLRNTHSEEV